MGKTCLAVCWAGFHFSLFFHYICDKVSCRTNRNLRNNLDFSRIMSMVFRFRMLSDENDNFVRDFEIMADSTLLDLHEFIIEMLGYDQCMASFFTADDRWERTGEFTLLDMGGGMGGENAPQTMASARLESVLTHLHDRLIYLFDPFNERAYYMELIEAKEPQDGMKYPRLQFEHSPAPDQYDPEANQESGSIFEEMMGEYSDFEGDDGYDDEY